LEIVFRHVSLEIVSDEKGSDISQK